MKKVALFVDGGYLRALCYKNPAERTYAPDYIEKIAQACVQPGVEELYRVLFYDCPPYTGTVKKRVSGDEEQLSGDDAWLHDLAKRDLFAVRRGRLKFKGWKLRRKANLQGPLSDEDFEPDFVQKGVDMRIGIDIALMSHNRVVERIALLTADTDFIPVMKHARVSGLQIIAIELPGARFSREFLEHVDYKRLVPWPDPPSTTQTTIPDQITTPSDG